MLARRRGEELVRSREILRVFGKGRLIVFWVRGKPGSQFGRIVGGVTLNDEATQVRQFKVIGIWIGWLVFNASKVNKD